MKEWRMFLSPVFSSKQSLTIVLMILFKFEKNKSSNKSGDII